ncbi:hypothetical protein FBUS_04731 [Fasciolopsis buskii]|uniref:Uncharacterized protein n=1 Tax=Fasciolopsis buskii TaxID=27845 RepID=A0A8E0RYX6_9TREM|nr:hypothetical protein FBUS_04731 [Fasciolopsis buski]
MTSEFNPAGEWDDNFTEYPSGSQKNQPDRSTPTKDCKICTNPSKNVFFDKHHVFLHPISIRLAKFTFKQSAVPNQSLVEYTIPDSVPKSLPLWYSLSQPMAFAIELTQLVEKRPKHVLKSNLNNSAFLVIWPDLTTASDESNDGRCFARLQVALSRDCREVRKSPFGDVTPTFLTESFSLQSLIQQATEAVSRIPGSA